MERSTTILLALVLATTTVPAAADAGGDGEVIDHVEDAEGRSLGQTTTVPGEPGLRLTEVWTYPDDGEGHELDDGQGPRFPVPFDPDTGCGSDDHDTWGFRWVEPYEAYANAHVDLLNAAGQTWNDATAGQPFGSVEAGEEGSYLTRDDTNQILFDDFGNPGWLAYAHIWWLQVTVDGEPVAVAVESDQAYDTADDLTTEPSSGGYDILGIATHEMGHTMGLQHAGASCLTMYPYIDDGSTAERTLGDGDIVGIQGLYGPLPVTG